MLALRARQCGAARGGGEGRAGRKIGVKNSGTDPAIANKIKGFAVLGGGAGAVVQICHCQYYTEKWHTIGVIYCDSYREWHYNTA